MATVFYKTFKNNENWDYKFSRKDGIITAKAVSCWKKLRYEVNGLDMEKLPDHQEPEAEEQQVYTPRPKGQVVLAWILATAVAIGVCLQFYWMMNT